MNHPCWRSNVDLQCHNSLALSASTRWYSRAGNIKIMLADIKQAGKAGIPIRVLGGGSNVVLEPFEGLTLTPDFHGINLRRKDSSILLSVGSGVGWSDLVAWCYQKDIHGLENLAMIPGSVGAAPMQNIGAYGLEISERLVAVDTFDLVIQRVRRLSREECAFGYRTSRFKEEAGRFIVCQVHLKLDQTEAPRLEHAELSSEVKKRGGDYQATYLSVCHLRSKKLPNVADYPNAGSFFKNPTLAAKDFNKLREVVPDIIGFNDGYSNLLRVSAARLIEACGWKGKRLGKAAVSSLHALTLVNCGGATSKDLLGLAELIRQEVLERFAIQLEREPVVV